MAHDFMVVDIRSKSIVRADSASSLSPHVKQPLQRLRFAFQRALYSHQAYCRSSEHDTRAAFAALTTSTSYCLNKLLIFKLMLSKVSPGPVVGGCHKS